MAGGSVCSAVSDPQEAQLGAEIRPVSDVREEVLCVTGSAGRHAGSIHHHVIVDVLGQDATSLQQNSAAGDVGVSTRQHQPQKVWVFVGVERASGAAAPYGSARTCWPGGC